MSMKQLLCNLIRTLVGITLFFFLGVSLSLLAMVVWMGCNFNY